MTSNNGLNLIVQESQNPSNTPSTRCEAALLLMILKLAEKQSIMMPFNLSEMLSGVSTAVKNTSVLMVGEKDDSGRLVSCEDFENRTNPATQDANAIFDWLGEEKCLVIANELASEKTRKLFIEGKVCNNCDYAEMNDKEIIVTLARNGECWAEMKCVCAQCLYTLDKEPSLWGDVDDLILQIVDMYLSGREHPTALDSVRRRLWDDRTIREFFKMLQFESKNWAIPSLGDIADLFDDRGRLSRF